MLFIIAFYLIDTFELYDFFVDHIQVHDDVCLCDEGLVRNRNVEATSASGALAEQAQNRSGSTLA